MPASANVIADILSTVEIRTVGAFNGVYLFPLAAALRAFLRALSRVGVIVPIIIALAVGHYAATATSCRINDGETSPHCSETTR